MTQVIKDYHYVLYVIAHPGNKQVHMPALTNLVENFKTTHSNTIKALVSSFSEILEDALKELETKLFFKG